MSIRKSPKKSEKPKLPQKRAARPSETVLGVRIEREIKEKLAVMARNQRRTLSAQALIFIEQGVKHHLAAADTRKKRAKGV